MSGFSPDWLALREPLDARSRAPRFAEELRERLPGIEPVRILDLATGTGSNLRYLAPRLGKRQEWVLVDNDRSLLDALPAAMRTWAEQTGFSMNPRTLCVEGQDFRAGMRLLHIDLADELHRLPFSDTHLVTASALLDLVSQPWLASMADSCSAARAAALFSLTYNGLIALDPPEPEDAKVTELVNRHQRTDKGFGPALGPAAAEAAEKLLVSRGYGVRTATSDWQIEHDEKALQKALLAGWTKAAAETAPRNAARLQHWRHRREAFIDAGRSRITVGHLDLLAIQGTELSDP